MDEKKLSPKRRSDPPSWSCLDDEQRDKIAEWYHSVLVRELEYEKEKKKKEESYKESASFMALVPFAAEYAYRTCDGNIVSWSFLLNFFSAYILFIFVFHIGEIGYPLINPSEEPPKGRTEKIFSSLRHIFGVFIYVFVTYGILNHIYK